MKRHGFLLIFFCMLTGLLSAQIISDEAIQKDYSYLDQLYKYLHTHPELSFKEKETSAYLAKEMRGLGYEVTEKVGGYGVVAVLKNGKGPTVMIRADMDALPIIEETGLDYASTVKVTDDAGKQVGVMHACGHDIHMTVWVGTARMMAANRKNWKGTLVFIAQPAEERGGGAKAMLSDGLYEKFPKPDYALALHTKATLAAGRVGYCPGYAMANVDMVDITVHGKGGHGAYPHTTIDPVVLAARMIVGFQTIISREISPLDPAVLTVGSIHGGTKGNVIGNEVKMELTLRSYTDEVRQKLIASIRRICNAEAQSVGLSEDMYPTIYVRDEFTPSLYNDPDLSVRLSKVWQDALGEENVEQASPVMGGEDFSRYGKTEDKVPVQLMWLGVVDPEKVAAAERGEISLPSLHSSKFAPVMEPSIKTGVKAMTAAALNLLGK